ncbi:MAG: hypothetical protein HFG89_00085 [Dorea sp.]|jgi:hypothetical protein|nr:hypothetical protein [Dorea sp.]
MSNGINCYELTLTPNYVSDWTFNDAIRELIQNGTDQEILDKSNKFSIDYGYKSKTLRLTNAKSKLKINTLLLGKSSKSDNEDTVGQFGEGYKIAALVLNRLGKTFTIYNNERNEVWTSRFKNSEKWLEKILAFYVEKVPTSNNGLVIEVGNVTTDEEYHLRPMWIGFDGLDESEKIETSYGDILLGDYFSGKIFVNGLKVSCSADMEYGYNFKPKYITLERDRKTCDSWNAGDITSKMIDEAMLNGKIEFDTIKHMIEENTDDVYHLDFNTHLGGVQEIQKRMIEQFDRQYTTPYSIPVREQSDIDRVKAYGGNPVVVPYKVANLLKDETSKRIQELVTAPSGKSLTLKERFQRWYDAYSSKLDNGARQELAELINEV